MQFQKKGSLGGTKDNAQNAGGTRFGNQRAQRKKTLVDIELDADSDLEDFENNNLIM